MQDDVVVAEAMQTWPIVYRGPADLTPWRRATELRITRSGRDKPPACGCGTITRSAAPRPRGVQDASGSGTRLCLWSSAELEVQMRLREVAADRCPLASSQGVGTRFSRLTVYLQSLFVRKYILGASWPLGANGQRCKRGSLSPVNTKLLAHQGLKESRDSKLKGR